MTVPAVPSHLPPRLSICSWIWSWITSATPGEPYADLEQAMRGLRERGFNAIRIEAGLNWCFRQDGSPRGPVSFGQFIPGYCSNFRSVNARGGGRHDVLARLIHLMELAKKYDIYVAPTSWEYQDSSWFLADPALREEVMAVPLERRLMLLAEHHNRLLSILKDRGLADHVAYVEVCNEPVYSLLPQGPQLKTLQEEAIGFLRRQHQDILIAGYLSSPEILPDNAQMYNQHPYFGIQFYFEDIYNPSVWDNNFDPSNPKKTPLCRLLMKDEIVPFEEFMKPAQNVRELWRKVGYLYHNVEPRKFDQLILGLLPKWDARFRQSLQKDFAVGGAAAARGIPVTVDESGFFTSPLNSRFEEMSEGLAYFEYSADLAIQNNYWGFMPTTYCGPEHPIWQENPQWLREINTRFLQGRTRG